jgi:hypothetical protein
MNYLYAFLIGCMTATVLTHQQPHTYESVVDIIWQLNKTGGLYVRDGRSYRLVLIDEK